MSYRSVLLGLSLGVFIAAVTFFNDFVVKQTMLVASHFPTAVFGLVVLVVLLVNPMLRLLGRGAPLRPAEIAVASAIALAACGWPGSGFWRYGVTIPSMPVHWHRSSPSWQANGVMSYVPGGTGLLAEGQVIDPPGLARRLIKGAGAADSVEGQVWRAIPPSEQDGIRAVAAQERLSQGEMRLFLTTLNAAISRHDLFSDELLPESLRPSGPPPTASDAHAVTRWNHTILANAYPELVVPLPRGEGALVRGGRVEQDVIDTLITGRPGDESLIAVDIVPWSAWWPTLRLWVGVALLLGLASVCVALIVHPQWSQRELLPYPIARLVEEMTARGAGSVLPDIARAPLFWIAVIAILAIRSVNGLNAWFPEVPTVPLKFDFGGFQSLFPNAFRVPHQYGVFSPVLFFSVIGFAFFIPTSASLSLGLAPVVWVMFGALLIGQGIPIDYSRSEPSRANFLRFGAFAAMGIMIFYTGRRYYFDVFRSTLGMATAGATPRYAVWAARALVPLLLASGYLLYSAGMEPWVASLIIAIIMLAWVVLNRIVCETGMIFVTNTFVSAVIVEGLVGFDALGPTGLILVVMTSWTLIADPRECVMPYIGNGLAIIERGGGGRAVIGRAAPWLVVMLVVSMLVAGFVTLGLQYEHGTTAMNNNYAARDIPSMAFNRAAYHIADAAAVGALTETTAGSGWDRFAAIEPVPGIGGWFLLGFVLVLLTASARLRLPGFPLHPVLFLVWGTYAAACMGFSFLLGCIIKTLVTRVGGTQAYVAAKPLMIGLIVGELLAALLWMVVGAVYYLTQGLPPVAYTVFPG